MTIQLPDSLSAALLQYAKDCGISVDQAAIEMLTFFLNPIKDKRPMKKSLKLPEIITQAKRNYSVSGYAGVRKLFVGLDMVEQATAMNFARSYPTQAMDHKSKRFADAFLQFSAKPIPSHKEL